MTYINKLVVLFDFRGKYRHESRLDYIARSVRELKEKALALHVDKVEVSGTLLGKDVDMLQRELKIDPISKTAVGKTEYSFTFVIPINNFLPDSSSE